MLIGRGGMCAAYGAFYMARPDGASVRRPGGWAAAMPPGAAHALVRVAAVIPAILLVLFTGLLWLLGLMWGRERQRYVTDLSHQAMAALAALLSGSPAPPPIPAARNPAEEPVSGNWPFQNSGSLPAARSRGRRRGGRDGAPG